MCWSRLPAATAIARIWKRFLAAGCRRVLLSHPGQTAEDVDQTIVFGMNHELLTGMERIVSAASCTTNAIVPVLSILDEAFGLEHAMLTTLHSVMNDQPLIDGYHHSDLHRTRSAMQSMIPVSTGLAGRATFAARAGRAYRIQGNPGARGECVRHRSGGHPGPWYHRGGGQGFAAQGDGGWGCGAHDVHRSPHASIDFNHSPHSAIVDGGQTRLSGDRLLNLLVWFDNEWGFANRMIDVVDFAGPAHGLKAGVEFAARPDFGIRDALRTPCKATP
jgi:glyceraldehyde 3-phosphate dehydrogenase/D-erythrose 4-phosphate dehydrogenase